MTMFESCIEIRRHFSDYLDGRCEPVAVRSIRYHLRNCEACREEWECCQSVREDLRSLPRRQVSPELALRLRVKLSQQLHRNLFSRLRVHLENAIQPRLLPGAAGVLTAIICFGLIMGWQRVPVTNAPDVPLRFWTPPRVLELAPIDFNGDDQSVVVVTHIDAEGRVRSYKVLSGQDSPELMHRLDRVIYFSLFEPATMFGKPTDGRLVLSLRRITVRG
jgi:hypothetical protein